MKPSIFLLIILFTLAAGCKKSKDTPTLKDPDIYVAGYENNAANKSVAKVWKNGTAQSLTDGSKNAIAYSVYVSVTDVYVAGAESNVANMLVAKVWKNGEVQSLTDGSKDATAQSVFVK